MWFVDRLLECLAWRYGLVREWRMVMSGGSELRIGISGMVEMKEG